EVLRAASTSGGIALLVLRGEARELCSLAPGELDRELLASCWETLALLHGAGIAHRRIDTRTVAVIAGQVGLTDFGGATGAPTRELLLTDRAQLLVTTAALAGPGPALHEARDALGDERVAELLPYLQPAALHGPLRRTAKT